jgi:hypothetical protein
MADARYPYACHGYSRVLGLREPPSVRLIAGRAYDEGVNALLAARMASRPEEEALNTAWRVAAVAFDHGIEQLPDRLDREQADGYAAMVEAAVACFKAGHPGLVPAALQTEHTYTVGVAGGGKVTVRGRSDYIEADGTIVENKLSGVPRWDREGEWDQRWVAEKRDQLVLYWLARKAEERRGKPQPAPVVPRGRFNVLHARIDRKEPKFRSLVVEFNSDDERRALEAVRDAHAVLRDGRLPARPGPACSFCGYRARCQEDEIRRGAAFTDLVGLRSRVTAPNEVNAS